MLILFKYQEKEKFRIFIRVPIKNVKKKSLRWKVNHIKTSLCIISKINIQYKIGFSFLKFFKRLQKMTYVEVYYIEKCMPSMEQKNKKKEKEVYGFKITIIRINQYI